MKDRNLCSDLLVSPFTIEVELLNMHKAPHLSVQLIMLHASKHISLKIGVSEGPSLDLGNQDNSDKTIRNSSLLELFESDALGDNEIKRVPAFLVVIVIPVVQKIKALVNWDVDIFVFGIWIILRDSRA